MRCLVLLFKDENDAAVFYEYLNEYKVTAYLTKQKTLTLKIEIIKEDKTIRLDTPRTILNYPPTKWMCDGSVNLITTGHFAKGREIDFLLPKALTGLLPAVQLN
jgi:hypothetical protein